MPPDGRGVRPSQPPARPQNMPSHPNIDLPLERMKTGELTREEYKRLAAPLDVILWRPMFIAVD